MLIKSAYGSRFTIAVAMCVLTALVTIAPASAQQEDEAQAANTGKLTFDVGTDFTTHYFFRGALQEDQGFIAQPWGKMTASLYEGKGSVETVNVYAGIWNSFQSEKTGANTTNGGPDSWYEADLYTGVTVGLANDFTGDVSYIAYTSPNDAFNTIQEIDLGLSYDDSKFWGDNGFALNPSAPARLRNRQYFARHR